MLLLRLVTFHNHDMLSVTKSEMEGQRLFWLVSARILQRSMCSAVDSKSDVPLLSQPDKLHLQGPGRSPGTDHPNFTEDTLQPAQEAVPVLLVIKFMLLS